MKKPHFCLLLLSLLCSCLKEDPPPDVCVVDFSDEYAYRPEFRVVFSADKGEGLAPCTRSFPDQVDDYYQILGDEVCPLEQNFLKILDLDPTLSDPVDWGLDSTRLFDSALQYIGMIVDGRKYVYLNGFYTYSSDPNVDIPYWQDRFVLRCDGGGWGALFDPATLEFSELAFEHR